MDVQGRRPNLVSDHGMLVCNAKVADNAMYQVGEWMRVMSCWAEILFALPGVVLPTGWIFDRTVTLEGAGTATAALTAALAYATNLMLTLSASKLKDATS